MSKLLNIISLFINSLLLLYFSAAAVLRLSVRQPEAAAIGIIGGADGPTSIYVTTDLLPFVSFGLIIFLLALCLLFELTFIFNLTPKNRKI